MRKIIYNGKLYNIRKMKFICHGVLCAVPAKFYQHNDGRFFVIVGRVVTRASVDLVKKQAEMNLSVRKYIKLFGPVEEA